MPSSNMRGVIHQRPARQTVTEQNAARKVPIICKMIPKSSRSRKGKHGIRLTRSVTVWVHRVPRQLDTGHQATVYSRIKLFPRPAMQVGPSTENDLALSQSPGRV
jgi:hypothetical protein